MAMEVIYKCPVCKETPVFEDSGKVDRTKLFTTGKKREKGRGGKYLDFHTGICKSCGTCFAWKTIEGDVFEDEGK